MKKKSNIEKYFADPKLLRELTKLAEESKMNEEILKQWRKDKKELYDNLHKPILFEPANEEKKITPRYRETLYIYIEGSTKEEYEVILN